VRPAGTKFIPAGLHLQQKGKWMLFWYSAVMLTLEAARVINMRLQLMGRGEANSDELFLMITEKLDAMEDAKAIVLRGGDPSMIVDSYRKVVAANVSRLS
jgi:hypothetical protein